MGIMLYNEFKHNTLAYVGNAKKIWKPKQKYTKWMPYKVYIKNVALNENFIDFFIINVYKLWEHLSKQIINDKSNHP
jgi:hypothetical protein